MQCGSIFLIRNNGTGLVEIGLTVAETSRLADGIPNVGVSTREQEFKEHGQRNSLFCNTICLQPNRVSQHDQQLAMTRHELGQVGPNWAWSWAKPGPKQLGRIAEQLLQAVMQEARCPDLTGNS